MAVLIDNQSDYYLLLDKVTNNFFYSTLCHICKKFGDNITLRMCGGCNMIFYCGREHQKEHWPEHKDLCKTIQYVREIYKSALSAHEGSTMMKFLEEMVIKKMDRCLRLYEVQMFRHSRMCLVCHKRNELECCSNCMAVWFCAQHKTNHNRNTCHLLKLCFTTDVSFYTEKNHFQTYAYMTVPFYVEDFSNIKNFISIYGDIKNTPSELSPELLEIKLSTRLTTPFTVIYGMRMLSTMRLYRENKKELVLHIIAAHFNAIKSLREWEILLHMYPNLKRLKLVLIGSEVQYVKEENVCDICKRHKKVLMIEWRSMSYADYVQMFPTFKIPNLVIRFLYDNLYDEYYEVLQDIWKSSLKHIAQFKCPFLLCYSNETNNIDEIINTELGSTIEYRCYKNPFASLKPCRKLCNDDDSKDLVYYENKYIRVYESLSPY